MDLTNLTSEAQHARDFSDSSEGDIIYALGLLLEYIQEKQRKSLLPVIGDHSDDQICLEALNTLFKEYTT
jgi:hypothetical protein